MKTILIIEDEDIIRETIVNILTQLKFNILTATEGEEALEVLKENHESIDIVISDINMPNGMGGLEFIGEVEKTEKYNDIEIYVMSGYLNNQETVLESKRVKGYLAKPFQIPALLEVLK